MGPPLNFHITAPPVQPNPYASSAIVPPLPNNVALQYAHSGSPPAPNVQPGGHIAQEGTLASQTLNWIRCIRCFPNLCHKCLLRILFNLHIKFLLIGYLGSIHLGLLNFNS